MRPIIDAHLDLAWNALSWKRDLTLTVDEINRAETHLDDDNSRGNATTSLPEMRSGDIALCFGTLLARVPHSGSPRYEAGDLDFRTHDMTSSVARGQLEYYRCLAERGEIRLIATREDLDAHWTGWAKASGTDETRPVGVIVAMEGADPIAAPEQAERWYRRGLRCLSLVHYGSSAYAVGTGQDGPLTGRGRALLAEMERLGIILDVTHLSDTSFFEALDVFSGAVLASHNNCRALVPHQRQLSDEQLRLLIGRDGVIGLACDAWMLHPGWLMDRTSRDVLSIDVIADHVDHICNLAGSSRHVASGSDLDGGYGREQTPTGLDTIADLQRLEPILAGRGYSHDDIDAIFHRNWIRFLQAHLPRESDGAS